MDDDGPQLQPSRSIAAMIRRQRANNAPDLTVAWWIFPRTAAALPGSSNSQPHRDEPRRLLAERNATTRLLHEACSPGRTLSSVLPSIHSLQSLELLAHNHFEFWTRPPGAPIGLTRTLSLLQTTALLPSRSTQHLFDFKIPPLSRQLILRAHCVSLTPQLSVCSTLPLNRDWALPSQLITTVMPWYRPLWTRAESTALGASRLQLCGSTGKLQSWPRLRSASTSAALAEYATPV